MNNWRLLLLAVVAVLQPIGSYTEPNLIDGHQECCDHRSNSITQETRLYGSSRKAIQGERRLNYQEFREDRRSEARNDPIRKVKQVLERTERRASSESARLGTETRFAYNQERRQRSVDIREPKQTRDVSLRIRGTFSRDSLSRYERDALDSRRIPVTRDVTRMGRDSNERIYEAQDNRRVREPEIFRRVSATRQTSVDRRGKNDVARDASPRNSRLATLQDENRLQRDNNRERRSLDRRVRDTEENRRSRSLELRLNSIERDSRRASFTSTTEHVDERRYRDQNMETRDRTVDTLRDSSRRTESMQSRELSQERRESRLERRQPISRESRLTVNVRSERVVKDDDRTNVRRDSATHILRVTRSRDSEGRQAIRVSSISEDISRERDGRRQPLTLDRTRSNERKFTARLTEKAREERSVNYRREVRSEEKLNERREQRSEITLSKIRPTSLQQAMRDNTERRQVVRSTRLSRSQGNADSELRNSVRNVNIRSREERTASRELRYNTERRLVVRSPAMFEVNTLSERVSRIRDLRDNIRDATDRVREESSISRESRDASERRSDTRSPARFEANTRSERESRIRELRDNVRDARDRVHEERSISRESRDANERRGDTRSPARFEANTRSERESRIRELRDNVRDTNDRVREERSISRESRVVSERRGDIRTPARFEANTRSEQESRIRELRDNVRDAYNRVREERSISRKSRVVSERRGDTRSPVRFEANTRSEQESRIRELRDNVRDAHNRVREERSISRESRVVSERRGDTRSPARFEVSTRSERESRIRELVNNVRNVGQRTQEDRMDSGSQSLERMTQKTGRRNDNLPSRTRRDTDRAASEERVFRQREETNRERRDSQRDTRDHTRPGTMMQRQARDTSTLQRRFDSQEMSLIESNSRLQRARSTENVRNERREARTRDETMASRDFTRLVMERRETRATTRDFRIESQNNINRNRQARTTQRIESRRVDSRSQDHVLFRQSRDKSSERTAERRSRDSRNAEIRSERLSNSRERRNNRVDSRIRSLDSRGESIRIEREVQPNRYNLAMERMDITSDRVNRDVRIESKLRSSDIVFATDSAETRREVREIRFRGLDTKVRDINSIGDAAENQNGMSWHMVFYTLQGAYLCGLLMQMLTEKSNNGKSKINASWWSLVPKDLVKVD